MRADLESSRATPPLVVASGAARRPRTPRKEASLWGFASALVVLLVLGYAVFLCATEPAKFLHGTVFAALLVGGAMVPIRRIARNEPDFDFGSIALIGLALRYVGAVQRFGDASDGAVYFQVGRDLAVSFRALSFQVDTGRPIPGTGTLRYAAGLAQVLTSDNMFASYIIWVGLSFGGCLLIYRAFAQGVVGGDRHRFAALLLCWPSLAFWPSSLGKEGFMLLGIGLATFGASCVFTGRGGRGLILLAGGITLTTLVRPHVSIIIVASLIVAVLAGRAKEGRSRLRAGARIAAMVFLVIAGALLAGRAATFFNVDRLGTTNVASVLEDTEDQTTQGGAGFTAATVRSPLDYPRAFITVLFRPFVTEARGVNDRLAAAEGTVLIVLMLASYRRLAALPTKAGRQPLVLYAMSYVLAFVFAFSSIGNFGILARQRIQVLPIFMMLLCLPAVGQAVAKQRKAPRFSAERRRAAPQTEAVAIG